MANILELLSGVKDDVFRLYDTRPGNNKRRMTAAYNNIPYLYLPRQSMPFSPPIISLWGKSERFSLSAAPMNAAKRGWGSVGLDLNSGWN